MDVSQTAGDWSDAALPDLVLAQLRSSQTTGNLDHGSGRFRCLMRRGQFVLSPPEIATSVLIDNPHQLRILAIPYRSLVELAGESSGLPADGDFGPLHRSEWSDANLAALIGRLWVASRAHSPYDALWADGALLQVASRLLRLRDGRLRPVRGGLAPWQVRRVTDYLDAHLEEGASLRDLSRLLDLSPEHLCRAFRASTGLPPYAWLLRRRVERAQAMMQAYPAIGLTEVALAVGYGSQTALGAAFKRVTGSTPTEWRRAQG